MKKMSFLIVSLAFVPLAYAQAIPESAEISVGAYGAHRLSPFGKVCQMIEHVPFLHRQELGGLRQKLEEKGYAFAAVYTGDALNNSSGGARKGNAYIGNLDLSMSIDTAKAGFWDNGTFFVYGIYNFGNERPSGKLVGDMQGIDNIEAPRLFKLFELWYEHRYWNDTFSMRGGLYNLNSEFDTTQYGALFLNSSFGIVPAISLNTTPSIFPLTSPAFRLKWDPTEYFTLQGAVLGGNPGDEDTNPNGLNPVWNNKTGTMSVVEGQVHAQVPLFYQTLPGTLKLGVWDNTGDVDDLTKVDDDGNAVRHAGNYGFYGVIDQMLFSEKDDQGLGVFFQYGQAPDDRNTLDRYMGMGLNYKGLLPNRDEDTLGVAFNKALTGKNYRNTGDFDKEESVFEMAYRIQFTKCVVIQPDFQLIHNPSVDPAMRDAKVSTVRVQVSF